MRRITMFCDVIALVFSLALAINARPSNDDGHHNSLIGIPHLGDYQGLRYPNYELQDLGIIYKGEVPSNVVKVTNTVALKIPKPYPVKVPHAVPYPVHVSKPYPVPVPHIVKVPHPVHVEVVRKVAVPVQVSKAYAAPENEYKDIHSSYTGDDEEYGGDHKQLAHAFARTSYGEPINAGYLYGQQETYNSHPNDGQNVQQSQHSFQTDQNFHSDVHQQQSSGTR